MKKTYKIVLILLGTFISVSCEDIVEIDNPEFQLLSETIFESEVTAHSAVADLYVAYNLSGYQCDVHRLAITGTMADEVIRNSYADYANFNATPSSTSLDFPWQGCYKLIYRANAIIEGVENANYPLKDQFRGEALFMRALMYFELINLYGDVPLILSTDINISNLAPRNPVTEIYAQILADLQDAYNALPADNGMGFGQPVRANKWAAATLLSRVNLYLENWSVAEQYASEVINSNNYSLGSVSETFKGNGNSPEAILQVLPVPSMGTLISLFFSPNAITSVADELYAEFEAGDLRKDTWTLLNSSTGQIKFNKYTQFVSASPNEFTTILRLAELYLIRSEARAQQNDLTGAQQDLNVIRNRAGLSDTVATTQSEILLAIEHERYVELFSEGHRWFDLKRTGRVESVLGAVNPNYQPTDDLWPIPETQINKNPNLTQNPGY